MWRVSTLTSTFLKARIRAPCTLDRQQTNKQVFRLDQHREKPWRVRTFELELARYDWPTKASYNLDLLVVSRWQTKVSWAVHHLSFQTYFLLARLEPSRYLAPSVQVTAMILDAKTFSECKV